ncbi:MAG: type I-U CRISPR-associated protein Csx17 [Bryobacteraceae bacterium]|nr:type I-U CRISPR-associated protein Csx17 [Bryobacteraceae bacterium]MDW8380196.1 type I-U CRISPR-associated protein Csx17 [Bryobacterales bacterium]
MSNPYVHEMLGLKPDTLATYLTALGIFRLLAEQKDPTVRGFWRDEHFVLVTNFDWDSIERFLLEDYRPTPILAPWNLESGFFSLKLPSAESTGRSSPTETFAESEDSLGEEADTDADLAGDDSEPDDGEASGEDEATGDPLIEKIRLSGAPRLAGFRSAIEVVLDLIPQEVRQAERDVQQADRKMSDELARAVADEEKRVSDAKADLEAKKASAKGAKREDPSDEALAQARTRLKQAEEDLKKKKADLKTKKEKLEVPVKQAKKRFKQIQSDTKAQLIADLRWRWGEVGQQWVDAAVALDERQKKGLEFTAIFGSGGNDGRMEFTRNFRRHLNELFELETGCPRNRAAERLRAALFGAPSNLLVNEAVGQFYPGRAGGSNMTAGFSGEAVVNPWEFVLMLEGAVALVAGMTRRGEVGRARVSSPFWVEAAPAGFASASELEDSPRGEQWLPLWSSPLRYGELVELIREGRAQVQRGNVTRAGDLVRAAARLGLARGIESLQRFAYLERNGQSNLAVSAGRFRVASRTNQALLEEVAPWIDRLTLHASQTRENKLPRSLVAVARRLQEALFAVCRHDASPTEWRELLVTLGDAEYLLLRSGKNPTRQPLPRLSPRWISAVDDGSEPGRTVLRLALALASQHRPPENGALIKGSVRCHFLPLADPDAERPRFRLDVEGRVESDPECVCLGRSLVADAIALVRRRSIWVRSANERRERVTRLPLQAVQSCEASSKEIAWWLRHDKFDNEILKLVRPLLALDWGQIAQQPIVLRVLCQASPDPLHLLFRLAHLPFDIPVTTSNRKTETEVTVRLDPEPLRRLAGGDLDGALRLVVRRLNASGLYPVFRRGVGTPRLARRLAASLAFPISRREATQAFTLVCKPYEAKEPEELD